MNKLVFLSESNFLQKERSIFDQGPLLSFNYGHTFILKNVGTEQFSGVEIATVEDQESGLEFSIPVECLHSETLGWIRG